MGHNENKVYTGLPVLLNSVKGKLCSVSNKAMLMPTQNLIGNKQFL